MVCSDGMNFLNFVRKGGDLVGDQLDELMRGRFACQLREFVPTCPSPGENDGRGDLEVDHKSDNRS